MQAGRDTFRDGVKGIVIKKANVDLPEAPKLMNVKLVEGLSANIISISQLCDQGYSIKFSKEKCEVLNADSNLLYQEPGCQITIIIGINHVKN